MLRKKRSAISHVNKQIIKGSIIFKSEGREEAEGENAFDAKKCSDPNLIAFMFFV